MFIFCLDQFFYQCFVMVNVFWCLFQILLYQFYKQQIGEYYLCVGGGDGGVVCCLFFGDSIQVVGCLLLQGVWVKFGDCQDFIVDVQCFIGCYIDFLVFVGVRDCQQKIVVGYGLYCCQQGMYILFRNSVDVDFYQFLVKVMCYQVGGVNFGDDYLLGVVQQCDGFLQCFFSVDVQ